LKEKQKVTVTEKKERLFFQLVTDELVEIEQDN
jgi:hypothetical protein